MGRTAFEKIAAIAHEEAGLSIAPGKAAMVRTRLARRLRALRLSSFDDYCALVSGNDGGEERREMISALTTNVTHFFREDHHFERLKAEVLPTLFKKLSTGGRVRIWSAGCSTGQEPYSIAMTILDSAAYSSSMDIRILATDIDPKVISQGRAGCYNENTLSGLPDNLREKYFDHTKGDRGSTWTASSEVRNLVSFRELNLLHNWPMQGKFNVIFCRNVVIYFDAATQSRLWKRFSTALDPAGWLFLGHSERVSDDCGALFTNQGLTAYRSSSTRASA